MPHIPDRLEYLPVAALRPARRNARTHSKAQVRQIADSITRFGFTIRRAKAPRLKPGARLVRDLILQGDGTSITELAAMSSVTPSYFTRIVRLGFLAPDITKAILDGCQPIELSALKLSLANLPRDWSEQRRELGFG